MTIALVVVGAVFITGGTIGLAWALVTLSETRRHAIKPRDYGHDDEGDEP